MSSSADAFTFDFSTSQKNRQPVFTNKQWTYQPDQQNGNYTSGQVQFDLSGFYNSQRFINPQEMFLAMPVVTTLTALPSKISAGKWDGLGVNPSINVADSNSFEPQDAKYDIGTGAFLENGNGVLNGCSVTDQFAFGFKSGYWNLINTIQIQVDGKDCVQLTPFINYNASFEAITSFSQSDVIKYGSVDGFLPDTSDSWKCVSKGTLSNIGNGICNNVLPPSYQPSFYPSQSGTCDPNTYFPGAVVTIPTNNPGDVYPQSIGVGPEPEEITTSYRQKYGSFRDSKLFNSSFVSKACVNEAYYERMKWTNQYNPALYVTGLPTQDNGHGLNDTAVQDVTDFKGDDLSVICSDNVMISEKLKTVKVVEVPGDQSHEDTSSLKAFRQTFVTCIVRLKNISNLFEKLPLTRGLYMRITLGLNLGYIQQSTFGSIQDPYSKLFGFGVVDLKQVPENISCHPAYTSAVNTFKNTCPILLSPLQVSANADVYKIEATIDPPPVPTVNFNLPPFSQYGYFPFSETSIPDFSQLKPGQTILPIYPGMAVDSGSFCRTGVCISVSIAKPHDIHNQIAGNTLPLQSSKNLTSCRIYAPVIELEPDITTQYITNYKQQAIYYKDTLWFSEIGVQPRQTFISNVGNGFVNLERLVIMPFYDDETVVDYAAGQAVPFYSAPASTYTGPSIQFEPTSPFSTAPATVAPKASITEFNIQISNVALFQRPIDYGFENFLEEMGLYNAINGGLDTGFTSGLLDKYGWENSYRYYVVDLSRRLAGDNTPKSIIVTGRNNTNQVVDYFYFLQFRRHLTLDVESGHLSVSSN